MLDRRKWSASLLTIGAMLLVPAFVTQARAHVLEEDFDTVTGSGGGVFFYGLGFGWIAGWDDGIDGENAFGATFGNLHADLSAQGDPIGGVGGTGAGEITVSNINLNLLDEDLSAVTGTGGGVFLQGDGVTANTSGFTLNWDDGISGEAAFAGTYGGAILVGDVSARGCLDCGSNGTAAGELVVNNVNTSGTGGWYAGLQWDVPGFPPGSGPVLMNAGFDRDGGTLEPWIGTGNVFSVPVTPRSGTNALKMWGQFTGALNITWAYQDVAPAQQDQTWELELYARHNDLTGDPLGDYLQGGNYSEMKIAFYDASDNLLSTNGIRILDENDPRDQYIHRGPIQAVAPAGTVKARAVITFVQPADGIGATIVDDVSFRHVGADYSSFYGQFGLTADVKGDANTGAGEVYGHYQVRIEDSDGDRLVFHSQTVADGGWTTLGGPLNTAVEQNAEQVNSNGAFNPGSDFFRVVVAFDNERAPTWDRGGTLTVDNLLLTNAYGSSGDDYYAGLFWDDLSAVGTGRMDKLLLRADIKGSVPGGSYELRLEGYNLVPCLDEDFETITSNGEENIVGPGEEGGTFYNWHEQVNYEVGIFGILNGVVTTTGGAWIRGLASGGYGNDGGCAQVEVRDVQVDPDGLWWAGLVWENQTLGSTDLSQISLTADIKGTWVSAWLQEPGEYMLRIEDPDGDYLGFEETANGSYQQVGGLLSNATTNGSVSGGDGVFDADTSGLYKVVVVFEGRMAGPWTIENWGWGGTLTVDNVQLTPCGTPASVQAGIVAFTGTADGTSFQSVGGLLSDAEVSTFFGEGGVFWDENEQNWGIPAWDSGIEGEDAFAGFWGAGYLGTASAQGCTDCGSNGSGGGWYDWTGSGTAGAGGWWIGVAWRPTMAFTDPSQVRLVGDFKGVWDPGEGQQPGYIYFKIESSPNNMREFRIPATATTNGWAHIDDTLDNAYLVGNLVYDGTEHEYAFVISCYGIDPNGDWGTGGAVYFDNLKLICNGVTQVDEDFETATGPTLSGLMNYEGNALNEYVVTVALEDGSATWGSVGGTVTVDNLMFTLSSSCDADSDLDLADFARFQACFSGEGGGVSAGCDCSDIDGDDDVDLADYAVFELFLDGPQ